MIDWLQTVFSILLVVLPAYTANGMALILGGGKPLDKGRKMRDGRRIFGEGKTVRGTILGILSGILASLGLSLGFLQVYGGLRGFIVGSAASLGAIGGDLLGSFAKRRFNIPRGHPVPFLDQLDFICMALLAAYLVNLQLKATVFTPLAVLIILAVTPFAHIAGNFIVYKAGKKRHPW